MATQSYPEFDANAIEEAIAAARRHSDNVQSNRGDNQLGVDDGELKVSAQCISVTVNNGQVCLNLPLGLGSICLPIPSWIPNGSALQACLDICSVWGVPCGVEVTVSFNGQRIVQKGFGCC